jgi:hypothetical protein
METLPATYQEHEVDFYNEAIISIQDEQGQIWVPVRRICENIGVAYAKQITKLQNDPKFNCTLKYTIASDNKNREMLVLPLEELNGWLFSINSNKVREDLRDKLYRYQRECLRVLNEYWTKGLAISSNLEKLVEAQVEKTIEQKLLGRKVLQEDVAFSINLLDNIINTSRDSIEVEDARRRKRALLNKHYEAPIPLNVEEIEIGLTPLSKELARRLIYAEKWCRDKVMLFFPLELITEGDFYTKLTEYGIKIPNRQPPIHKELEFPVVWDRVTQNMSWPNLVKKYNKSNESLKRCVARIMRPLELIFYENRTEELVTRKGYKQYMDSRKWEIKRDTFKPFFRNTCFTCGAYAPAKSYLHHHRGYGMSGQETPYDVQLLCESCNQIVHKDRY